MQENPLSSTWEERARERRFARPMAAATSSPNPSSQWRRGIRWATMMALDTDAFGVRLSMKFSVYQ
jgi:hypothetical protein